MCASQFSREFRSLVGVSPFPWQVSLYDRFVSDRPDNIPASCILPTGLGKTSVIAVWLIALAHRPDRMPRRLVYVVNRRTVVDQTTVEVEKLRSRLGPADLKEPLRRLCAFETDVPLAISTLRGQFADNRAWSADPARPAVIVGTVDMIGSRLLFSGYNVGFKGKPLHAGFLGQDALVVHDEAHLEPAFQKLLLQIQDEQRRCKDFHPLRVMELTATPRHQTSGDAIASELFELTPEEQAIPREVPDPPREPLHVAWRRQAATKKIHLHENRDEKKLAEEIVDLAANLAGAERAILVFARRVEDVEKIVAGLTKRRAVVQQLTGTMRGLERDEMADPRKTRDVKGVKVGTGCQIFARFLKRPPEDAGESEQWKVEPKTGTVYLVCTSAGEVGVNLSADHLVCDLATFDSMAQRFGRVNRFGDRDDTEIHVVHPREFDANNEPDVRRQRTLELLRALEGDGCPRALSGLDPKERLDAFAPPPMTLLATDILFDAWALTSTRDLPGRPPVEPYLHGKSETEPPATQVAWRKEVWVLWQQMGLHKEAQTPAALKELAKLAVEVLDSYPLKPHELLRDRSDRVFKHLGALADRFPDQPVWLVDDDGGVEPLTLRELTQDERGRSAKERIQNRTILLPDTAGGLVIEDGKSRGVLSGSALPESELRELYDVADEWWDESGARRRVRVRDGEAEWKEKTKGMRLVHRICPQAGPDEEEEPPCWNWFERPAAADGDGSRSAPRAVPWESHTEDVSNHVKAIAASLHLESKLRRVIELAADYHDLGKRRVSWQRSIGNPTPEKWLAKGPGRVAALNLTRYRHEFGSLVDLVREPSSSALAELDDDQRDLLLHLIAAHHGRGRPHFDADEAFDPTPGGVDVAAIAADVPRRFARLQRKYGRWGLAYLESILRAADWAASAKPSKFADDGKEPV